MEAQNQSAASRFRHAEDARHQPRFKIEVAVTIHSRSCGTLRGHTLDLSESGIGVLLTIEVPVGEFVELEFTLPFGEVKTYAIVRQRNAFRYGFQFVNSNSESEVIRSTYRQLAMEQSLLGEI